MTETFSKRIRQFITGKKDGRLVCAISPFGDVILHLGADRFMVKGNKVAFLLNSEAATLRAARVELSGDPELNFIGDCIGCEKTLLIGDRGASLHRRADRLRGVRADLGQCQRELGKHEGRQPGRLSALHDVLHRAHAAQRLLLHRPLNRNSVRARWHYSTRPSSPAR
jgi:hypothetical protein